MATTVTRPEPRAAGGAPTHRPAATPDIKRTPSSLRAAHVTAGASGDWWVMVRRGGRVSCLMWSVSAPSNKADTNTQGHNIKNNYTTYIFQMVELQNMGLWVRAPQLANKLLIVHICSYSACSLFAPAHWLVLKTQLMQKYSNKQSTTQTVFTHWEGCLLLCTKNKDAQLDRAKKRIQADNKDWWCDGQSRPRRGPRHLCTGQHLDSECYRRLLSPHFNV